LLLSPIDRQIEFGQTRHRQFGWLPTLHDRFDKLRAQEGEIDEAPDVAPGDALAVGKLMQRSSPPGGELFKPGAPAGDGFLGGSLGSAGCASGCPPTSCSPPGPGAGGPSRPPRPAPRRAVAASAEHLPCLRWLSFPAFWSASLLLSGGGVART